MTTQPVAKRDIRTILWDITCLGGELASVDDSRLDDTELALDSLALVWLIIQLERRIGRALSPEQSSLSSFRTVNAIHSSLTGQRETGPA
ncbi:acyl carrier protein [Saccharopolyspora pogona]|uniref:acyl carrier protein n=1 Tax=Saccharopolyspora pogona TaxID=333966 RepID=UPI0016871B0C|nr:acyl carrier protein [Saccharopolyspora pogona]